LIALIEIVALTVASIPPEPFTVITSVVSAVTAPYTLKYAAPVTKSVAVSEASEIVNDPLVVTTNDSFSPGVVGGSGGGWR
jgi:hypothetical protein